MACFFRLFFNLNQTFMFRTIFLLLLMVLLFDGCYRMRTSKGGGQISAIPQRHIDASDVALPHGYTIQPVTSGLTFPTAVTTDDDGSIYAIEAGYSYGEVWGEPKLLNIDHTNEYRDNLEDHKTINMKRVVATLMFVAISLGYTSCMVRKSEPITQETFVPANERIANGERMFMYYCQKCHIAGEGGLGPAINPNPAPGIVKRLQMRLGLGVMPSFNAHELSKKDAHDISKYLHAWKTYNKTMKVL
jgi:cytochrome c2